MNEYWDVLVEEPAAHYGKGNAEMELAWQFIANTNVSVFLTGKAGTGKTTFLKRLREALPKRMVVLAPTGVAAINASGQTIHSFFQISPGPFLPGVQKPASNSGFRMSTRKKNLLRTLDLLVIDEVSMVRADLLDQVDSILRQYRDRYKPFGGVQLLLIGDLMQLAPVTEGQEWSILSQHYRTPYFFSSDALQQLKYVTIELTHIYRQQDQDFIDILGKVRSGEMTPDVIAALNSRYIPDFQPMEKGWISLTTHNRSAQMLNEQEFAKIQLPATVFNAKIEGNFPDTIYPTDVSLALKVGAQVMFVKNDPSLAHQYYNGKIGEVTAIGRDRVMVKCQGDDKPIEVIPVVWENTKFILDDNTKEIRENVEGTFSQLPLRLAWAITVHKSQGLTFDKAMLDINASFAHGQVYVALSRCRTLGGLVLSKPIALRSVITDRTVDSFITHELENVGRNAQQLPAYKYEYALSLLDELYGFTQIDKDLRWLTRVVDEDLATRQPLLLDKLKESYQPFAKDIIEVAARFRNQYVYLMQITGGRLDSPELADRIQRSARYFYQKLKEIIAPLLKSAVIIIENKALRQKYNNALESLKYSYVLKTEIFGKLFDIPFSTNAYLNIKAKALLTDIPMATTVQRPAAKTVKPTPAKPKAAKGATIEKTHELYRDGKSPEQIAKAHRLTVGTIWTHLEQLVMEGRIPINELISPNRREAILKVASAFTESITTSAIKEKLPADFTYPEIRLTLKSTRR